MARRKSYNSMSPITLPSTGEWVSGLQTCGIGVAVHKDLGYVANIFTGDIIKPTLNKSSGTLRISLPTNNWTNPYLNNSMNQSLPRVIRLVLDGGAPPRTDVKMFVYHINGNKEDILPSNLEWGTRREVGVNNLKMGKVPTKLGPEQVREIRQVVATLKSSGESVPYEAIARANSICGEYAQQLMQLNSEGEYIHWSFVEDDSSRPISEEQLIKIQRELEIIDREEFHRALEHDGRTIDNIA